MEICNFFYSNCRKQGKEKERLTICKNTKFIVKASNIGNLQDESTWKSMVAKAEAIGGDLDWTDVSFTASSRRSSTNVKTYETESSDTASRRKKTNKKKKRDFSSTSDDNDSTVKPSKKKPNSHSTS
jgi:hypothetical protein